MATRLRSNPDSNPTTGAELRMGDNAMPPRGAGKGVSEARPH